MTLSPPSVPKVWPECRCGCGEPAPVMTRNRKTRGQLKGEPAKYVRGHAVKGKFGSSHHSWRGGRTTKDSGYFLVTVRPDHPHISMATLHEGSYRIPEHRIVMADQLGRSLTTDERVHHINGDRTDNRIENLELWTSNHPPGQRVADLVVWAREILSKYGDSHG